MTSGDELNPEVPASNQASTACPVAHAGHPPPGSKGSSVTVSPAKNEEFHDSFPPPPFTFSARTCLDLVDTLSPTQLETEFKHLLALDADISVPYKKPTTEHKRALLYKHLAKSLCIEADIIVNEFHSLLDNISRSLTLGTRQHIDVEQTQGDSTHAEAIPDSFREHPDIGKTVLQPPVRVLDLKFADIPYDDVTNSFTFTESQRGGRETVYFGAVPYSYGAVTHHAAEYPDLELFNTVSERLKTFDPDFSTDTYTCLVTRYNDGKVTIPLHADKEQSIVPHSSIITVSFGAARTVRFRNTVGPISEQQHKLEHGAVHVMTAESQLQWKHCLQYEPRVTDSRISLTFRKLSSEPPVDSGKTAVPPIAPPSQSRSSISPSSTSRPMKRVLFITDSILKNTPEFIFESIPDHACVKRTNYQLADLDGFSPEFRHSDYVVVSCGINDLARYGHTPNTLADITARRFKEYSARYPGTKFIFNSLLHSRDFPWLNEAVDQFNSYMIDLAEQIRNLFFFDSHSCIYTSNLRQRDIFVSGNSSFGLSDGAMRDSQSNNGVHITLGCRKMVTGQLVNAIGYLAGCREARFRSCKWLRCVTTRSSRAVWAG